ncbi:hypothetical protein [Streptomyces noursei]|uniref:hypothetical protein n=1 Tax=Streptomyces noursei TaxID=1971 RepID=UPI001963FE63|nr:hypothetical protein [Streptomyces noursei]QRX90953.1 hypothetical protein JNO44_09030 [Streptomyces noursei]
MSAQSTAASPGASRLKSPAVARTSPHRSPTRRPRRRVCTCTYRPAFAVEVADLPVDDSPATSPQIRTDRGTGVS